MRPQDQDLYENFITTLEFQEEDPVKWEALFDIYSKDRNYIGDLNILFKNFGFEYPIYSEAIPRDAIKSRLNCGQRCMYRRCSLCPTALQVGL